MALSRFIAQQLGRPSGIVGKFILGPVWNKRNLALNDVAFDNLALSLHDRVLEVGFGGGYLLGRVLADDGKLVMCFTCQECMENREFVKHGVAVYEAGDVRRMIESSGFHDIHIIRASDRHREFVCMTGKKGIKGQHQPL